MAYQQSASATALPDSVLLLALPKLWPSSNHLRYAVAGATALELINSGRARIDGKRLEVTDPAPTGNALLDTALNDLSSRRKPPRLDAWLMKRGKLVTTTALGQLENAGVVTCERRRMLGIIPRRRYRPDPAAQERVRADVHRVLVEGQQPDDPTTAIIGLLAAARETRLLWEKEERDVAKARLGQIQADGNVLAVMDAIGRAIKADDTAASAAAIAGS